MESTTAAQAEGTTAVVTAPVVTAPVVTVGRVGRRRVVICADAAARAGGVRPGDVLAKAQARMPTLAAHVADAEADVAALTRLASWAGRYTPLVSIDPPDGLWLDTTGCDHLHGGETAMLADLRARVEQAGYAVRAAVADTPGCAHAVARHATPPVTVVPAGLAATIAALDGLPIEALRLTDTARYAARRIGIDRIGTLRAQVGREQVGRDQVERGGIGRGPLARRLGAGVVHRLDQALGHAEEPLTPLLPAEAIAHRLSFAEPLGTADSLAAAVALLVEAVCGQLERAGQGALRLDLIYQAMDQSVQAVRVGTARPTRAIAHLTRILVATIDRIEAERGIERIHLVASLTDTLVPTQTNGMGANDASVAELVDRLTARLGIWSVWRSIVVARALPERSVARLPPLGMAATGRLRPSPPPHRPLRLLDPPQPIDVMALLPDHPPALFIWRRQRHRIRRADGPERLVAPWWPDVNGVGCTDGPVWTVRDYYTVEDEAGLRYWVMRNGDGVHPETGDLSWFLHGLY